MCPIVRPEDIETWRRALTRFRERKNEFLRQGQDSPLSHADREAFRGLSYFEPDPVFRLEARLKASGP